MRVLDGIVLVEKILKKVFKSVSGRGLWNTLKISATIPWYMFIAYFAGRGLAAFASGGKSRFARFVTKSRSSFVEGDTIYVFAFMGEFGYELFNWQGVVRKFSRTIPSSSKIVIAGRKGLNPFYESASQYIDISDFAPFKESIAASYFAIPPDINARHMPPLKRELSFDEELRNAIRSYIMQRLDWQGSRVEFVFSSNLTLYPGCVFGVDRRHYGFRGYPGRIYDGFDFLANNNVYRKIDSDKGARKEVEEKLGFTLDKPYILVQTRSRKIGPQHGLLPKETIKGLLEELSRYMPVVLLSFSTGRLLDSESYPEGMGESLFIYNAASFREQGCLIEYAARCVFFTEGDLGSHTYLPPFMGKDVVIVAPKSIFSRQSAPIQGWNEHIFRFGGRMIPLYAESVVSFKRTAEDIINKKG